MKTLLFLILALIDEKQRRRKAQQLKPQSVPFFQLSFDKWTSLWTVIRPHLLVKLSIHQTCQKLTFELKNREELYLQDSLCSQAKSLAQVKFSLRLKTVFWPRQIRSFLVFKNVLWLVILLLFLRAHTQLFWMFLLDMLCWSTYLY